jgi:hypothetical protein
MQSGFIAQIEGKILFKELSRLLGRDQFFKKIGMIAGIASKK